MRLSCGARHSIACCEDGDVFSWGFGLNGRLGHGSEENELKPRRIEAFLLSEEQKVVDVAAGDSHSMALTKDGNVFTWGSGSYGRLGLGTEMDALLPQVISCFRDLDVTGIACSTFHSLAVVDNTGSTSSLFTWGGGAHGKLGIGSTVNQTLPVPVPFFEKRTRKVINAQCGHHHTVAITSNGLVFTWGYGAKYRCGTDDSSSSSIPRQLAFFDSEQVVDSVLVARMSQARVYDQPAKAEFVSAGRAHTAVLANMRQVEKSKSTDESGTKGGDEKSPESSDDKGPQGGEVFTWGDNSCGQLGAGLHLNSSKAQSVDKFPPNTQIAKVVCGSRHTIAVDTWGTVYAWGANDFGQLGLGDTVNRYVPTTVLALQGTKIARIYAGANHSAAVHEKNWKGTTPHLGVSLAYVWGANDQGQCGLQQSLRMQLTPTGLNLRVPHSYNRIQLSLGAAHSMVLCTNYFEPDFELKKKRDLTDDITQFKETNLYQCGSNQFYQLGAPSGAASFTWTLLTKFKNWESVCKVDQLDRESADAQRSLPLIRSIVAGATSSFAVLVHPATTIEALYGWGLIPGLANEQRLEPEIVSEFSELDLPAKTLKGILEVQSLNELVFDAVAASVDHFLALLRLNGNLSVMFSWGKAKYGKLGIGNAGTHLQKKQELAALTKKDAIQTLLEDDDEIENSKGNFAPTAIALPAVASTIKQISIGDDHCVYVTRIGSVYAWGFGDQGRLGQEKAGNFVSDEPIPVVGFAEVAKEEDNVEPEVEVVNNAVNATATDEGGVAVRVATNQLSPEDQKPIDWEALSERYSVIEYCAKLLSEKKG